MIYAIHKVTKEHRIATTGQLWGDEWALCPARDDGWIPWHGGECPLPDGAKCEFRMRRHGNAESVTGAENLRWAHVDRASDIIAYRPILDAKPEAPEWDGEGLPPAGARVEVEDGCKGTVLAAAHLKRQGSRAWLELDDGGQRIPSVECIRPLRTAEDKAVEEMAPIICDVCEWTNPKGKAADIARALYRAGYRKEESK